MLSNTSYQGSLFTFYPFFLSEIFLRHKFYLILLYIHHLWFLLYLFGFSLVALPLCIWLRSAAGQKWLTRLERCPRNLLTLVLPLLLIRLSLLPLFPQYCSFADAACWLLIYIYGYILFSRAAIEQVIHQQARRMLRLTLIQSVIMLILWCSGFLQADLLIPQYTLFSLLYQAIATSLLWSSLIVTLMLGSLYMNWTCPLLTYSRRASFYWYLLHFPIVVISGYYILSLSLPAWCALSFIAISTFPATFILTDIALLHAYGLGQLYNVLSKLYIYQRPLHQQNRSIFHNDTLPRKTPSSMLMPPVVR